MLASMANRPRPRCPTCNVAMIPLFFKRPSRKKTGRGRKAVYHRVKNAFACEKHGTLARGRTRAKFLTA